jgi:hypothetical protein
MRSRSQATIAARVGAVLLGAATAAAQVTPTTERVMKGALTDSTVPSTNVPGPVAITYYLPKDYDAKRAEPYPLLISTSWRRLIEPCDGVAFVHP